MLADQAHSWSVERRQDGAGETNPPENNSTGRGGFQARSGPSPKFAAKLGQHAQIVPVGAVGGLPLLAVAVGPRADTIVLGTIVDLVLSDCSLIKKESIQSKRNYSAKGTKLYWMCYFHGGKAWQIALGRERGARRTAPVMKGLI